jgi:rRNA-processing protein FCF1
MEMYTYTGRLQVVLDTNFLLIPGQFKVDIFKELERIITAPYNILIFEATFGELEKIAATKSRDSTNAKLALKLIKQKNLKSLQNSSIEKAYIDRIILDNLADNQIVCTQDTALKRQIRAKNNHVRIITLKSRQTLGFG